MSKHQKSRSQADANYLVPESLTQTVIQSVLSLPSGGFSVDYLKQQFLTKFVSDDTAPSALRQSRAIEKWLAVEERNSATEDRLWEYPEDYQIVPRTRRSLFEESVRHFIRLAIGELPDWSSLNGGFSGGASTSRSRGKSFPAMKYLGKAHITQTLLDFLGDSFFEEFPVWSALREASSSSLEVVPGNVMFTVPKSTEIDRVAAKEPDLNMYIQRGLGKMVRNGLRRFGINLNDQSINRNLAREGSADGSLATLDLSSASDSVTTELVARFLPPIWYTWLNASRSVRTLVPSDGGNYWHENVMFSSMGNGFTFELESLLFWALAKATGYHTGCCGRISVYGDDIIVPTEMAPFLEHVLWFYGFTLNRDKSFSSGPFRESCGGHYLNGVDVTPFFLRRPIKRVSDLILFLNNLRRWDALNGNIGFLTEELWYSLAEHVDKRFWGGWNPSSPYSLVSPDSGLPDQLYKLVPIQSDVPVKDDGVYLSWLDSAENRVSPTDSEQIISNTQTRCRARKVPRFERSRRSDIWYYREVVPPLLQALEE